MRHFIILILLLCKIASFAQNIYSSKKEIVVINMDSNKEKFFRAKSDIGKEIYVLNYRLKLAKDYHSRIGDNADMMFTFYIAPDSRLELRKIKTDNQVFKNKVVNLVDAKNKFEDENYVNNFNFKPILKIKTDYYSFNNATVLGQGFLIEENPQYFPKFGAKSSKFKLNLLSKPYSAKTIDSLRKVISKDSTSLKPYGAWVDDFMTNGLLNQLIVIRKKLIFGLV